MSFLKDTDIKGASVVSVDDTQPIRLGKLSGYGKTQDCQIVSPYGLCSNPPEGSLAIAFNVLGHASNTIAIVDNPQLRKKELEPGEVAIVNYDTESEIYLKSDGSIDLTSQSGAEVKLNADESINISSPSGAETTLNADGSIDLISPSGAQIILNADGTIAITGTIINITGNIVSAGTITAVDFIAGSVPSYIGHVHPGVTSGLASTGGPV